MNYCLDYYDLTKNKDSLIEKANEITIPYSKQANFIELLMRFQDKRINIELINIEPEYAKTEFQKLTLIHEQHPDMQLYLKIPEQHSFTIEEVKTIGLPYFYATRVNDIDMIIGMLKEGVSDIYIVDTLGFDLAKLSTKIHSAGARIRVFPNVAQSEWKNLDGILKFFIRPEDLEYYSQFVDTIEFFGKTGRESVLYDIYFKDKKWFGPLDEIMIGLNSNIDNRFITQNFAEMRSKCGKRCGRGGKCDFCHRMEEIVLTLKNKQDIINKEKRNDDGKRTSE